MRYSPEQKATSREALVRAAARMFREKGFEGVGVDELSSAAGLTSGSFYKHFAGKAQVLLEVMRAGTDRVANRVRNLRKSASAGSPEGWVNDFASFHTSPAHIAAIALGCNLPALTPEIIRAEPEVKQAYEQSLLRAIEAMLEASPLAGSIDGRARAIAMLAVLSGGTNMARAVRDDALSNEIAEATRRACLQIAHAPIPDTPRSDVQWSPADF
ncbi:TetR/AcrR family transcriptional regulator [Sphingomonas morindae]|uniref:TetR/AcrR family transcriptional regulator n=1 Tax=Sphingomonas morindae TaxID=1541170 RepID=A0ABY4XE69_9SPHN|nr:TetR/AcrR family transcriptional regulator [Sphingomonas morindae]USI75154.1 TetR/AcrR family transcriptional regulator [Sphingomonas morindae]